MHEQAYEKLTEALSMRGGAIPAIKCPELYALLRELFTPEEAALASQMPMNPIPAIDLAAEIGRDPGEVERILEGMANKGLVLSRGRGGVNHYQLMQLVPGIFEYQFMKGEVNDRAKRLAHLFEDYSAVTSQAAHNRTVAVDFPFARVIPIEMEITAGVEVQPYDRVSHYIENSEYITVATCYCRHHGELLGRPCDKPKDVCLFFGPSAKFIAERGFGRSISRKEALEVLDRAEEAGLVHCTSNTGKYIEFICNCCTCHCGILQSLKSASTPSSGAVSGFILMVDEDKCMGCGDCIDRCPMDALSMQDDIVVRDADRCIGCGLCVSACPTGGLRMEPSPDRLLPPWDRPSLNAALLASMKKDSPSS